MLLKIKGVKRLIYEGCGVDFCFRGNDCGLEYLWREDDTITESLCLCPPARIVRVLSFTLDLVEKSRVEGRGVKNFSTLDF
jgi:hypothetical protein